MTRSSRRDIRCAAAQTASRPSTRPARPGTCRAACRRVNTHSTRGGSMDDQRQEMATLAGGCFWCVETVFERLRGVTRVVSGYTGGATGRPSYEDVCTGRTGHAEAVQITFDPGTISYREILDIFFA